MDAAPLYYMSGRALCKKLCRRTWRAPRYLTSACPGDM